MGLFNFIEFFDSVVIWFIVKGKGKGIMLEIKWLVGKIHHIIYMYFGV